ncbi:MAG: hypothetical protein L0Y76_02565, partial [Ignavibacteria bacterium]|nr:hypothetical protein [Ignavibacteria bacterium]
MGKIGYFLTVLLLIMTFLNSKAQTYEGLEELAGYSVKVYYSPGNEARAKIVTGRCDKTIKYVNGLVGFIPEVSLF